MPQDLCTADDVTALVGDLVADLYAPAELEALLEGDGDAQGLIEEWSRWFEQRTGIVFEAQTKTYYLSGKGTNMVMLPEVPMQPITSMTLEYQAVGEGWTESTGFAWTDAGVIRLSGEITHSFVRRSELPRFAVGVNNVRAVVAFGSDTVPRDVRQAVKFLCAIDILGRYGLWLDKGIKERQLGDRRESYGSQGRFSAEVTRWQAVIDQTLDTWNGGLQPVPAFKTS